MKLVRSLSLAVLVLVMSACHSLSFTSEELSIIEARGPVMKVYVITNPFDSLVLRRDCIDFTDADLQSDTYRRLADQMVATVTSPEQDGVGIAGPQVGLNRRVVAVQRFDKEGEPFEVYPNIRITAFRGEKELGAEGCLSVPDRRGEVLRYQDIDITYTDVATMQEKTETVQGFTAVIFQHECDHLDGVLYIDKLN